MSLGVALYVATVALLFALALVSWLISRTTHKQPRRMLNLACALGAVMGACGALAVFNAMLQLGWLVAP